jgi:hypothetical protein
MTEDEGDARVRAAYGNRLFERLAEIKAKIRSRKSIPRRDEGRQNDRGLDEDGKAIGTLHDGDGRQ